MDNGCFSAVTANYPFSGHFPNLEVADIVAVDHKPYGSAYLVKSRISRSTGIDVQEVEKAQKIFQEFDIALSKSTIHTLPDKENFTSDNPSFLQQNFIICMSCLLQSLLTDVNYLFGILD